MIFLKIILLLMFVMSFILLYNLIVEENGFGYIYIIINNVNGKVYIGQTRQRPGRRWIQHKSSARTGETHPLYNSMRYHGIKNFSFDIINKVPVGLLDHQEKEMIRKYKSNIREYGTRYGYNLTAGGLGMTLIYIEQTLLEDLIIRGLSRAEICEELRVSRQALDTRLQQLWEKTLREVRKDLMGAKIESLIVEGYDVVDIAIEFNRSRNYIYDRLQELWNTTSIYDVRLILRKSIIRNLLQKGTLSKNIGIDLGISRDTVISYIEKYWEMTYTEAKHYFMKPYIKSLIENGLSEAEIVNELNINRYETVFRYIKEYWGINYVRARQEFFIKPLLRSMIEGGYNRDAIAVEFDVNPNTVNEYTKRFWNMTFTQARHQFFVIPSIKKLDAEGHSIRSIAENLGVDDSTIHSYRRRFFG